VSTENVLTTEETFKILLQGVKRIDFRLEHSQIYNPYKEIEDSKWLVGQFGW
jgi:hypothetical protein